MCNFETYRRNLKNPLNNLAMAKHLVIDEYEVLYCKTVTGENDLYYFGDCAVNILDSWINEEEVKKQCGYSREDPEMFAISCIDYYGIEKFIPKTVDIKKTGEEVKRYLNLMGVEI